MGRLGTLKWMDKKLRTIRNKGLRKILGAYRATSVPVLEKEAQIPPIDLHLDKMLLLHEGKQLDTPIKAIAKKE
jgi:hypothetical protein